MNVKELVRTLLSYANFDGEVDDIDKIHETIEKDLVFKGTNLWILVFAILVAAVGLNMNSTAVIIGAMLISPLMGPINGMGYSIATYNFPLFRKAVKNFGFAVGAGLVASTMYFSISPISTAHSELLARTSPTIYDVLIAFFGGLAGIVAISSKQKGNVIPGVAIATALMPPLCTAGYGLATAQFSYFFGALYLFTINTVFIGIAAMIVSQILEFPIRTLIDTNQKKQVNRWISAVIIMVLIPSIYFGYNLVVKERFMENANRFIRNVSIYEGNYLLKHEINPDKQLITLVYGGSDLTEEQKANLTYRANDFDLGRAEIKFQQGLSFDNITKRTGELEQLKAKLLEVSQQSLEKDRRIDSLTARHHMGTVLLEEIQAFYPFISDCLYTESYMTHGADGSQEKIVIVVFSLGSKDLDPADKTRIRSWVRQRIDADQVKVFFD
ncbi:MAG TPA: DUF389 domain-containing protein [Bacteroidales bacterium]|nr:DUF389 domain-containing protein [Lentimicrobiaceae bacterium]HOH98961.1 DUF389 domain-containing protein [Bacteroidales bacterium]